MKCPECAKAEQRSTVRLQSLPVTLMCADSYYDEEGQYHHHDPNIHAWTATCSKGHLWQHEDNNHCWCGWET